MTEKTKEILSKYKVGKKEIGAMWKAVVFLLLATFGMVSLLYIAVILFCVWKYGVTTIDWKCNTIIWIVSFALTCWLQKDIYILTKQEVELVAIEMSDEVYERAMERWREHHGR